MKNKNGLSASELFWRLMGKKAASQGLDLNEMKYSENTNIFRWFIKGRKEWIEEKIKESEENNS